MPKLAPNQRFDFNLNEAKQILDQAGYKDTNGDGIREMPGGGKPLRLRYAVRQESADSQPTAEFITGWLKDIGIAHDREDLQRQPAHRGHRQGRLRPVRLGLDAVRRPRPDDVVLHLRPGQPGPEEPDELLQRRELVRQDVQRMYKQQNTELDPAKRKQIVQQMLTRFYESATYVPLYYQA